MEKLRLDEACMAPDDARRRERLLKIRKGNALLENPSRRISGRDVGRQVPVQQAGTALVGSLSPIGLISPWQDGYALVRPLER